MFACFHYGRHRADLSQILYSQEVANSGPIAVHIVIGAQKFVRKSGGRFGLLAKRQPPSRRSGAMTRREGGRTGALKDASRISGIIVSRAASWTAAALRRFSQRHIKLCQC